ncbi:MAG: PAS domain-containing protein [Candidatus Margulisbacteria bacterium]|nr:PAS domain-containing protein [Candidatus Margulisiibacteriota bacterium]
MDENNEIVGLSVKGLIDALPFYVILVDEDHTILMANEQLAKELKLPVGKIIGSYCPKLVHGMDSPFPGCPLEEAKAAGHYIGRELYDARYDRWFNSVIYPTAFKTKKGKKVYFHTTFDITVDKKTKAELEKKTQELDTVFSVTVGQEAKMLDLEKGMEETRRAEERLKETNALFEKIAQGITDEVLLISKDFKIVWANNAILKEYNCGLNDIVGKYCYDVTHHRTTPCIPPHDVCPIADIIASGEAKNVVHEHFDEKGNKFKVEIIAYPIKNYRGEIVEFLHISRRIKEAV